MIRNINAQRLYFGAEVLFDFTLALCHYSVIIIGVGNLGVDTYNIRTCESLQYLCGDPGVALVDISECSAEIVFIGS